MIISIFGTMIITFVNSLLTGNMYGKEALAAMNLIYPVMFIYAMFGCLISIGGSADDTSIVPVIFSAAGIFFFNCFLVFLVGKDSSITSGKEVVT